MEITVAVKLLKEDVQRNLVKHKALHDEAMKGYQEQQRAKLAWVLDYFGQNGHMPPKTFDLVLEVPRSHEADYENALSMLSYHVGEQMTLGEKDFNRYVNDDWEWKHSFTALAVSYGGTGHSTANSVLRNG